MKRSINLIRITVIAGLLFFTATVKATSPPQCYYLLKVYHYKTKTQEEKLDNYFKNAYMPALGRAGSWQIGVFKTLEQDTDKRFYVLITFKKLSLLENADKKLVKDQQYLTDAKDFIDAAYNDAPYTRFETIVMHAFWTWKIPDIPKLTAPKTDRIYELRSYESATEKLHENKVKMFNDGGETVLFNRLNFNAVFYADVIVGSHMPNLMYMTSFNSMADRDTHWKTFGDDPVWKKLVAEPEYQHNVSKADRIFLHPTEYSNL